MSQAEQFDREHIIKYPLERRDEGDMIVYSKRVVYLPIVSDDPEVQARYAEMRRAGESHNMAEMLATRKFPGFVTDDIFMKGRKTGDQFDNPGQAAYYHQLAEQAGVSTSGQYYCAPLASYPGDPTAWIGGRSDVERIAREKGLRVEGMVNYEPPERPPTPDVPVARDILDREVRLAMEFDPDLCFEAAEEQCFRRLTGRDEMPLRVEDDVPSPDEILSRDGD